MIAVSSVRDAQPITPDVPFPECSAIWVGLGGDLEVVMASGATVLFSSVPDSHWMPIKATKVTSNTTSTELVAGYF